MTLDAILALAPAIYLFCVYYALRKGYDVKAALKVPFIGFTFEANRNVTTESDGKLVVGSAKTPADIKSQSK